MSNANDYDGAWKEALERYLESFISLCFPAVAANIDWSKEIVFLDSELQEVVRDAELGKQRVDKLVRVTRLDGKQEWVLLHIEVQSRREKEIARRMYQYHHRIVDRFEQSAVTLLILADLQPGWRVSAYESETWGCKVRFEFPVCKLLDLEAEGALERPGDASAIVIAAYLEALRTGKNLRARFEVKLRIMRRLFDQLFERQDVLEIFRILDWLLTLPDELTLEFREKMVSYNKAKVMPLLSSFERLSLEQGLQQGLLKGRQEGRQEAILRLLALRMRRVPEGVKEAVREVRDSRHLDRLLKSAAMCADLEEFASEL